MVILTTGEQTNLDIISWLKVLQSIMPKIFYELQFAYV